MNLAKRKDTMKMKNRSRKITTLAAVLLGTQLASCSDKDLTQLHSEEIRRAQLSGTQSIVDGNSENRETVAEIIASSTLVFSDEFSGAGIDETKWNTRYNWGPDAFLVDEQQYYVDTQNAPDFGFDPFVFDGEVLSITAQATPADLAASAKGQPYLSGVLTTSDKFAFTHGYAEIKARMPEGVGLWPAFFMLGAQNIDLKPQLFVVEGRGSETSTVYHRYNHANDAGEVVAADRISSQGADFSADFHVYGVAWAENKLTFYIDGVRRHTISSDKVANQDMYLLLNLAVGGSFAGVPDADTALPASFDLDYVRVYHRDQ